MNHHMTNLVESVVSGFLAGQSEPTQFYYLPAINHIGHFHTKSSVPNCSVRLVSNYDPDAQGFSLLVLVTIGDSAPFQRRLVRDLNALRYNEATLDYMGGIVDSILGAIEEAIELYEAQRAHKETT